MRVLLLPLAAFALGAPSTPPAPVEPIADMPVLDPFEAPAKCPETPMSLAKKMAELSGYPAEREMGYPCPGSFGTKYGVERGLEVITVESPYLMADERGWLECRSALRWCVDLPD